MTIAAVLCWYDEPTTHLERCVSSLTGIADTIVAIDGRWLPFPGDRFSSPLEQSIEIRAAAHNANLNLLMRTPVLWPSQIEKRDYAMLMAGERADWLLVIDADEWIHMCDTDQLRRLLDDTDRDVALIAHRNVTGDDFRNMALPRRRLYRTGTRIVGSHQGYVRNGVQLEADHTITPRDQLANAIDLMHVIEIHHAPQTRSDARNQAAREYRHARANAGER